jgi:hypothetical protein
MGQHDFAAGRRLREFRGNRLNTADPRRSGLELKFNKIRQNGGPDYRRSHS